VPALVHASGVIHSHDVAKSGGGDSSLENGVNFRRSREGTGLAASADEDVMTVLAHPGNLPVNR